MKARVPALAVLLVAACGEAPPPAAPPPRATEAEIACPVEGTRFLPSRGVDARAGERVVKVCSRGCAIRFELAPERYGAPR